MTPWLPHLVSLSRFWAVLLSTARLRHHVGIGRAQRTLAVALGRPIAVFAQRKPAAQRTRLYEALGSWNVAILRFPSSFPYK